MTCDLIANGPCTVAVTGACKAPVTASYARKSVIVSMIRTPGFLTIDWYAEFPYDWENVEILLARKGLPEYDPLYSFLSTDSTATIAVTDSFAYNVWLRDVNTDESGDGPWIKDSIEAFTDVPPGNWVLDPNGDIMLDPDGNPIPEF